VALGLEKPAAEIVGVLYDKPGGQRKGFPKAAPGGQVVGAQEIPATPVGDSGANLGRGQTGQIGPLGGDGGLRRCPKCFPGNGVQPRGEVRIATRDCRGTRRQEREFPYFTSQPVALGGSESGDVVSVFPPGLGGRVLAEGFGP
jgi:hypothetical protein